MRDCREVIWGLYLSRAMQRLVGVSLASKAVKTSIPEGIWVRGVENLKGQLDILATLVSSSVHPDLVWWDNAIMQSKLLDAGIG